MTDKTFLHQWRARVGNEEAARVTKRSSTRGTAVHKLCESLVMNESVDLLNAMPSNLHMYKQIEKQLLNSVDNIRCSEASLFSHYLKIAGTVDLVADWKGKPAIIDFKTSGKTKRKDWIENYFLQASMYSYMLWEMTKIQCPNIVIIIAVEEENEAQVFEERTSKYIEKARTMCQGYHKKMLISA